MVFGWTEWEPTAVRAHPQLTAEFRTAVATERFISRNRTRRTALAYTLAPHLSVYRREALS